MVTAVPARYLGSQVARERSSARLSEALPSVHPAGLRPCVWPPQSPLLPSLLAPMATHVPETTKVSRKQALAREMISWPLYGVLSRH